MGRALFATIVLSIMLSPLAALAGDTTLYGKLRYSFGSVTDSTGYDNLVGSDNTSLLGVKGKYGDDIQAFFHLQTGAFSDADADGRALKQRFFFGGLKTAMGTVKYGRMTNAYKMPGFKLDRFYNTAGINAKGVYAAGGATYGLSGATNGFTNNALEYSSPKIAEAITVHGGLYIDDSKDEGDGVSDEHGYTYGAKYSKGGITAGVVGAANEKSTVTVPGVGADQTALRGYGKFKGEGWSVGASYEMLTNADADDTNYIYAVGSYNINDAMEAVVSFGMVDSGPAEGSGYTGALFYSVAKNTKVFGLYSGAALEDGDAHSETDPSVIAVGAFHNFSLTN